MLERQLASSILDTALSTGGDFAEIFVEDTKISSITLVNGKTPKESYQVSTTG